MEHMFCLLDITDFFVNISRKFRGGKQYSSYDSDLAWTSSAFDS